MKPKNFALFMFVLMVASISAALVVNCNHKEEKVSSPTTVMQSNNDPEVYQKLEDIKSTALTIWSKYQTKDTLRWKKIQRSIEMVSFSRLQSVSGSTLKVNYFETGTVTTLQLLVCDPKQLDVIFNGANSQSGNKMLMVFRREDVTLNNVNLPPQARKAIIYLNAEKLSTNSIHSMALCLIHELNHVYQYIYLPNIKEDERESDAWKIELEAFKASITSSERKEFKKRALEQRKKKYDPDVFFIQNESWLKNMFGQANKYADLFAVESYGFDIPLKGVYKNLKK